MYLSKILASTSDQITLDALGPGFSCTVAAVLANRLLLAIRKTYYTHNVDLDDLDTFTSLFFRFNPVAEGSHTEMGSIHLSELFAA